MDVRLIPQPVSPYSPTSLEVEYASLLLPMRPASSVWNQSLFTQTSIHSVPGLYVNPRCDVCSLPILGRLRRTGSTDGREKSPGSPCTEEIRP